MTAATIDATIVTVIVEMTDIVVTAPGRLPAVANMMNVAGPRPPGGRLMIKSLQGTMITGAEVMMIAEGLMLIMTAVGMIKTAAGTTGGATTKMTAMTTDHQGRMAKDGVERIFKSTFDSRTTGGVEWFLSSYYWTLRNLWSCRRLPGPVYFSIGWPTLLGVLRNASTFSVTGPSSGTTHLHNRM